MAESPQNKEVYGFGRFELDVKNRLLRLDGETVPLTLKEFEVLLYLVENAGQVVEKDDLLNAVWKDTFIAEGTLTQSISRLRKKLETANKNGEKFIETLPKRGYRFISVVTAIEKPPLPLMVEERSVQHIRVEERISIDDVNGGAAIVNERLTGDEPLPLRALLPAAQGSRSNRQLWLVVFLGIALCAAIAFAGYQFFSRNSVPKIIVASRVVAFSGLPGLENTPAFSPDGKQIAFSWDGGEGGKRNIFVKFIGAGEPLRLTDSEFTDQYPSFSPDGKTIAFIREFKTHGEVWLVPALGGAERRICRLFSGNYSISFAPDGENIAVIDTENSTEGGQHAVYLVNIQTGERRRLTAPAEFVGETTPRFSPDGKNLAFIRIFNDQKHDLFVVPAAGGEPRRITSDRSIIHSLTWSADGQMIYFVSFRGSNQPSVWRISASGGNPEIVSTGGKGITNIAFSPDNKTLAFVESVQNTDIWRAAADGLEAKRLFALTGSEESPQFSPDGSRIVFLSDRTGKNEVWLAEANGKNLRQLTDSPFIAGSPRFSPGGTQIVYDAKADNNSDIFVVSAEGGASRRLNTEASDDILPSWSPDEKWIYFTSDRSGETNIWKMPASGGEAVQITRKGAFRAIPSPDGKTIYFTKANDASDLWHIPPEGGEEQNMPKLSAAGFAGIWTVKPAGIYFLARNPDQTFKFKFYEFSSGIIKDAADYKIPGKIKGSPDITANASEVIYSLEGHASNIMLAEIER